MFTSVSPLAILAAGVAAMAVGFAWYSPMMFGNQWMELMGITKKDIESKKEEMGKIYGISFVRSLIGAFVLSQFLYFATTTTIMEGLQVGFLAWLGFTTTAQLTEVLFGGKPVKLYLINTGYQLASILAMSVILTWWG